MSSESKSNKKVILEDSSMKAQNNSETLSHSRFPHIKSIFPTLATIVLSVIVHLVLNKYTKMENIRPQLSQNDRPTYWIYGKNIESGYLKHVFLVLDRLGYKFNPNKTDWDLLWAHDYPFRALFSHLHDLEPHQRVNHFPGCGYITNKVDLATSNLEYIPAAFKLPGDNDKFLAYARVNPTKLFVQKSNDHRNIYIKSVNSIDLNTGGTFVQEFVDKPFLVDGYKFDIGVYTIITSIDPLRVYMYNGDILFRFCMEKYYPFNASNTGKYVVGDDYLPIWEVPSLSYYYNELGLSMRDTFNAYSRSKGKDPSALWYKVEDAIRNVILEKEPLIINVLERFKSKRNFFEMMRFDLVVDENLDVYIMEANMSPNLSSAHYPPNQLLYEQVIYNLLALVGVAEHVRKPSLAVRNAAEELMLTADKNIAVFPIECSSALCRSGCMSPRCQLCRPCLSPDTRFSLVQAYREHMNRQDCKRIFPPPMTKQMANTSIDFEEYSVENQLQYRWFQGKCLMDDTWCA